jgi:hypothetical protein
LVTDEPEEQLIKIGAKVVSHRRYVIFQMAEVAIPRQMFQEILRLGCAFKSSRWEECVPKAKENRQINPSASVRAARCAGSRPQLASGFQEAKKSPLFTPVRESSGESRLKRVVAPTVPSGTASWLG